MAEIVVKEILEAGVHYGHRSRSWNPKMRPYIYGRRNQIHIIDIKETIRGLVRAKKYLMRVAAQGSLILFVGTKRQAAASLEEMAGEINMPFCTERWLGGTLTNFRTVRSRLKRLEELEELRESGVLATYSKKMQSTLLREYRKIYRNLNGIRDMNRLPECLVVVDPNKERNAVHEAHLLGIKVVALIDTDSDPDLVDLPIPGNDDSLRSIRLITQHLCDAIKQGKVSASERAEKGGSRQRAKSRTEHQLVRRCHKSFKTVPTGLARVRLVAALRIGRALPLFRAENTRPSTNTLRLSGNCVVQLLASECWLSKLREIVKWQTSQLLLSKRCVSVPTYQ